MLYDTVLIGNHDWYLEGRRVPPGRPEARRLVAAAGARTMRATWDTCFAILFLKRATRSLDVASTDRYSRK